MGRAVVSCPAPSLDGTWAAPASSLQSLRKILSVPLGRCEARAMSCESFSVSSYRTLHVARRDMWKLKVVRPAAPKRPRLGVAGWQPGVRSTRTHGQPTLVAESWAREGPAVAWLERRNHTSTVSPPIPGVGSILGLGTGSWPVRSGSGRSPRGVLTPQHSGPGPQAVAL